MRESSAKYRVIIENLLQRARQDPRLMQLLTPQEIEAIREARNSLAPAGKPTELDQLSEDLDPATINEPAVATEVAATTENEDEAAGTEPPTPVVHKAIDDVQPIEADLETSSVLAMPPDELRVCVDFGTAYSKAAVAAGTYNEATQPVALHLGQAAAQAADVSVYGNPFVLESALYVSADRFWFGPKAVLISNQERAPGRARFESPKRHMIENPLEALRRLKADQSLVPGEIAFTYKDLLTLYFAYFTHVVASTLLETGFSPLARRRFALPSWEDERSGQWSSYLGELMARGQILADSAEDYWHSGLPLPLARMLLDKLETQTDLPVQLLGSGIPEAVAASNAVLRQPLPGKRIFTVVDVGAGTADMAAFVVLQKPDDDEPIRAALIAGTSRNYVGAGDQIDEALIECALQKAGVAPDDATYAALSNDARRTIRGRKEAVFQDGFAEIEAGADIVEPVTRDELLRSARVQQVAAGIHRTFHDCIAAIGEPGLREFDQEVFLYLTGGSAVLPFVKKLAGRPLILNETEIRVSACEETPAWLTEYDPLLVENFRQLAVAVGGALPELPKVVHPVKPSAMGPVGKHRPVHLPAG